MTLTAAFKRAPCACILAGSFIVLFAIQLLFGVNMLTPNTADLIDWGANIFPLTMGEQPWRLISSAFLHIGLMHLLFNTWAMYVFGSVAEPILGSKRFLAVFLLSATGGGLLNNFLTWYNLQNLKTFTVAAGASGGIMGLGAALLVIALFKISLHGMILNARALLIIMAINLIYGFFVPGIDNAGHIGGALTGAAIALAFVAGKRCAKPWLSNTVMCCIALLFIGGYYLLHQQVLFLLGLHNL